MDETERISDLLVEEFLDNCDLVISAGMHRGDYSIVARVARAALCTAVERAASHQKDIGYLAHATEWYERCKLLDIPQTGAGRGLQGAISQAREDLRRIADQSDYLVELG